jgi:hypothetical protein
MNGAKPKNGFDIWIAPNSPPFDPKPLLASTAQENFPSVSTNGRWMASGSFETDAGSEVYVRPFPAVTDGRWQVSTRGGLDPRWARNSQELYYLATQSAGSTLAYTLTAVPIAAGSSFSMGAPTVVAQLPVGARAFDVATDGRFLISMPANTGTGEKPRQSVIIVQNWPDALRSKLAQPPAER